MLFSCVTLFVLTVLMLSSNPLVDDGEKMVESDEGTPGTLRSSGRWTFRPRKVNRIGKRDDTFLNYPFVSEKDHNISNVMEQEYQDEENDENVTPANQSSTERCFDQYPDDARPDRVLPNECLDVAVVRIPTNQTRIVGGNFVKITEYPYMAQVISLKKNCSGIFCGGSLISRNHVLTAGHCVTMTTGQLTKPKNVRVRLGATYISYGGEVVMVSKINRHPAYKPLSSRKNGAAIYDLAVLKLKKPVKFSSSIAPVSLATYDDTAKLVKMAYMNWPCKVLGWGWTKPGILESSGEENVLSKQLMLTTVHLVDWTECRTIVPILEKNSELCCASPHSTSGCKGDSGGPLVCEGNKEYGLVSRGTGAGCGIPNLPYIYTRLDTLHKYISKVMKTTG